MSTTTMHFGPEWMRTKHQLPSRTQPPPSPPPASALASGASTYSALVSSAPPTQMDKPDETHPFRYSKEEMLRIFREGAGKGGLGLEVERWDGVVRETGSEPVGIREMSDTEKKLFAGPLNSDLRRRQSTDYPPPLATQSLGTERPRLNQYASASGTGSPMRERFGTLRRRDSTDPSTAPIPRKQSLSSLQSPMLSPRDPGLPSPRPTRGGYASNFDGVLGGSESWVSRRRASEASLKSGVGTSRDSADFQIDDKSTEIREEEEEHAAHSSVHNDDATGSRSESPGAAISPARYQSNDTITMEPINLSTNFSHLSVEINGAISAVPSYNTTAGVGPPPGLVDPASVEWCYKDPQGQVQGPFRADLMQKWFDEGYFSPDLPMRRAHIDTDWILVEEIARRSSGDKIFLSPPLPSPPPGLPRRAELPALGFPPTSDQNAANGPYQPAPIRTLRSSTLDSFLGPNSNPSDSPSSSYGAGGFGNGSPDPSAFGGRAGSQAYVGNDGRIGSYSAIPDSTPSFSGRRNTFNDSSLDSSLAIGSPSFGTTTRVANADGYPFGGVYTQPQTTWRGDHTTPGGNDPMGRGHVEGMPFSASFGNEGTSGLNSIPIFGSVRNGQDSNLNENAVGTGHTEYGERNRVIGDNSGPQYAYASSNNMLATNHQFSQSPVAQYSVPQQLQPIPSQVNSFGKHAPLTSGDPQTTTQANSILTQSPWNHIPEAPVPRRPGPFDASHPTASNTIAIQPTTSQSSPWDHSSQPSRPSSKSNEPSTWLAASQGVVDPNSWKEAGPNSLTVSNVGQHNQQQQQLGSANAEISTKERVGLSQQALKITDPAPTAEPAQIMMTTTTKPRPKASTTPTPSKPTLPVTPVVQASSSSTSTQKPAWPKEDDLKKAISANAPLTLREIQEAESKKVEVRKSVERERERASRASASAAAPEMREDAPAFTASWGLPTSQAGARSVPTPKDTSASSSPVVVVSPVWAAGVKPPTAKKSMKEIQEEEERRKKLPSNTTAAAAARRAHTESTTKVSSVPQSSVWTTVGPSGKPSAAAIPPPRPVATTATSTPNIQGSSSSVRTNGTGATRATTAGVTTKPVISTPKHEDPTPSHDFLKWLNDSLKGLNNAVNVEEIMSMLLSFPLDPDASTGEIISDLIYANSTTLDGRRFATEFISRRKMDASSRPKVMGASGPVATKPVSIADVVKATPKPSQPEWGFKVVNKKKKGGRT